MRRSTLIAATATMAATVLFAGCGTSSDSSSTDNSSSATSSMAAVALSKPDFIKAADAICAADNSQASQSASSIPAGPSGAEQQKDLFLSTYRTELQKLRALTPPPEDQAAVNDIWNAWTRAYPPSPAARRVSSRTHRSTRPTNWRRPMG